VYTFFETLQVIGVNSNFEFDVATANPPWMNANEDGVLSVHSKRSRTPVQPDQVQRFEIDQRLRMLEDMVFEQHIHKYFVFWGIHEIAQVLPIPGKNFLGNETLGDCI